MKTRSFLLVALIATGFFTACNNDVAVESLKSGQEISFRLQGGMPEVVTRATATTLNNLDAFVVWGTDDVLAATSDFLFEGKTVAREYDPVGPIFNYYPKVYYSDNATLAGFFAFSPVSAQVSAVDVSAFLTGASFEYEVLPPDGTGNAVQEDFLVAGEIADPATNLVSLDFKHALSRIFVKAISDASEEPVIIKKLTLKNLKNEGKLEVEPNTPTPTALVWDWDPTHPSSLIDYNYCLAEAGVAVPAGLSDTILVTSMEQGMMILPQEVLAGSDPDSDFALEVTYDFANLKGRIAHVFIPAGISPFLFEAGKQYNIIIAFSLDGLAIEFDVAVSDFDAPVNVNP